MPIFKTSDARVLRKDIAMERGINLVRECPECGALVPKKADACHRCGYTFEAK